MDVKEAIEKRRSIRKYKQKEVPEDVIKEILEAARLAPSAYNTQPWKFFVVKDEEKKKKLRENGIFYQDFVYTAPVIIICCGDPGLYPEKYESWTGNINYTQIDVTIATQNIVLRATELGLGTCYIALIKRDKLKEILDIPENYIIPYAIPIGYPDEDPSAHPRKSMDDIIIS